MSGSAFLQKLLTEQEEAYRVQPYIMRSHFNDEEKTTDDYQGRQLLELLQNADDAAQAFPGPRKMFFRLTERYFAAANTGEPFSEAGVRSLMIANLSPKQLVSTRMIGYKGLGFRSLLSWSRSPWILSGNMALTFDQDHALAQAVRLAEAIPELKQDLEDFALKAGVWPVPVLKFPKIPSPAETWYQEAQAIQAQGYQTVILLPLEEGSEGLKAASDESQHGPVYEKIFAQLNDIWGECLIFCQALEELEIEIGERRWHWQLVREQVDENQQQVLIENKVNQDRHEWSVFKRIFSVPESLRSELPKHSNASLVEIGVALPKDSEVFDENDYLSKLHAYFPTNLEIPLKVLLHATLNLDSSRKHLGNSKLNEYILAELAGLTAKVLETHQRQAEAFDALNRIIDLEHCDSEVKALKFVEQMKAHCGKRTLFHNQAGELVSLHDLMVPSKLDLYPLLPPAFFPNILARPRDAEQLTALHKMFNSPRIPPDYLSSQLEAYARTLKPEQVGELLANMHRALPAKSLEPVPRLLLDDRERRIEPGSTVFLRPDETQMSLPSWASDLCFLHAELMKGFRSAAEGNASARQFRTALQQLGYDEIREYSFQSVLTHLYAECDDSPEQHRDLIRLLYSLYAQGHHLPLSQNVRILSANGVPIAPSDCYLGAPYPQGELLQALLSGLTIHFAGSPTDLGLGEYPENIEAFLLKLGVKRRVESKKTELNVAKGSGFYEEHLAAYFQHTLRSFKYPLHLSEVPRELTSAEDLQDYCRWLYLQFQLPEFFPQILHQAPTEAILAWVLELRQSKRLSNQIQPGSRFWYLFGSKQNPRLAEHLSLPDPVWFLLKHIPWLEGQDGRHTAAELYFPTPQSERLFSQTHTALKLDISHPLLRDHPTYVIEGFLQELGVLRDLISLDADGVYTLLLQLPETDPQGQLAPGIYRKVLKLDKPWPLSPEHKRFLKEGRLWGSLRGQGGYFPVQQLRVAGRTLTRSLRHLLPVPLFELDVKGVEEILGVKTLQEKDFQLFVREEGTLEHPFSQHYLRLIHQRLPYILAYRLNQTRDLEAQERRFYQNLAFHVCTSLQVSLAWGDDDSQATSESWEGYLPVRDVEGRTTLYLTYPDQTAEPDELFWQILGDGLAEASGLFAEGDTFAGFFRARNLERLLRYKVPERAYDYLAKAREILSSGSDLPEPDRLFALPPAAQPRTETSPEAQPQPQAATPVMPPVEAQSEPNDDQGSELDPGQTTSVAAYRPHSDSAGRRAHEPKARELVITGQASNRRVQQRQVFDEATSLRLVMAYEESQGRFPLDVSHVRGLEGFGCDVVSVGSAEEQQLFKQTHQVNSVQVLRFIEAKGRRTRNQRIALSDNELRRAIEMGKKFYIYVLYEAEEGYDLEILPDPITSDARVDTIVFDLSSSQALQSVWLTGEANQDLEVPEVGFPLLAD